MSSLFLFQTKSSLSFHLCPLCPCCLWCVHRGGWAPMLRGVALTLRVTSDRQLVSRKRTATASKEERCLAASGGTDDHERTVSVHLRSPPAGLPVSTGASAVSEVQMLATQSPLRPSSTPSTRPDDWCCSHVECRHSPPDSGTASHR